MQLYCVLSSKFEDVDTSYPLGLLHLLVLSVLVFLHPCACISKTTHSYPVVYDYGQAILFTPVDVQGIPSNARHLHLSSASWLKCLSY